VPAATHGIVAPCRHCSRAAYLKARGLCHPCYRVKKTRDLYPALPCRGRDRPARPRQADGTTDRMTEAELDAVIAEQSRPENLPAWWARHVEYQAALTEDPHYWYLRVLQKVDRDRRLLPGQ
jgi:hypothetical protein